MQSSPTPTTRWFSFSRFMRLLRAHWAERRRSHILFWLVVASVHALLMLILLSARHGRGAQTEEQTIVFWCGLVTSGVVFASLHFAALRKPASALVFLTRPASVFEKWLLAVLFVLFVWPLAYTISAMVINALASTIGYQWHVAYENAMHQHNNVNKLDYALFIPFIRYVKGHARLALWHFSILMIYMGLSGFSLLGCIYFKKYSGIKTSVLAFVIFLLTILLSIIIDTITNHNFNFRFLNWWENGYAARWYPIRYWISNLLFWLVTPVLVWICALLALHEKDLV